jgi:hypothetical protein
VQVLKIALLCLVDHECITNCLVNWEACQEDSIAMLFTNVVFKSSKNNVVGIRLNSLALLHEPSVNAI